MEGRYKSGFDKNGKSKYKSVYGKSYAEVKVVLVLKKSDCSKGISACVSTIKELSLLWLSAVQRKTKESSTAAYITKIQKYILPKLGSIRFDVLSVEMINELVSQSLTEKYIADIAGVLKSILKYAVKVYDCADKSSLVTTIHLSFISTIIDYAIKMDMLSDNPCRRVTIPKGSKKERKILTIEETEEFFDLLRTAPLKYRAFFTLDIYSGMRRGEMLGLEWHDINFETGVIHIQRTSNYTKARGIYTDDTKTKGSNRYIKVPKDILDLLESYRKVQANEFLEIGDKYQETDRLFTKWDGRPMNPQTPYGWLKEYCEENDFPFYGVHTFRYLNASLLIGAGIDVATVSGTLGHSNQTTTLSVYSHMFQEYQVKVCDAVANALKFNSAS